MYTVGCEGGREGGDNQGRGNPKGVFRFHPKLFAGIYDSMQPGRVPSQGGAQKLLHASWNTKENWPNYFVKEKGQVPIREPERERERDVSTWSTIAAAFSYLLPLVIAPTRRPTNTFTAPLPWLDNPSGPSARPLRRRAPLLLLGSSGSSMAGSPTLRIQLIILSLLSYYNPLILQVQ